VVDSRLLQANERTLLASVRTSIALMTFGFVIARIGVWLRALGAASGREASVAHHEVGTAWVGGVFVVLGVAANALAIVRCLTSRRAIRRGEELPHDALPIILSVLVTAFGAVIGVYLIARLR
jgi:putative membrane protein